MHCFQTERWTFVLLFLSLREEKLNKSRKENALVRALNYNGLFTAIFHRYRILLKLTLTILTFNPIINALGVYKADL